MKDTPKNIDAERFVLGAILLDDNAYTCVAGSLTPDDFSLETHRRIFRRMCQLKARDEKVDRVTVANELQKFGELETCGGLAHLISLDDGMPQLPNIDSYIHIVKTKSSLRRIVAAAEQIRNRALLEEDPGEILAHAESTLLDLGESRTSLAALRACDLLPKILEMASERARQWEQTGKAVMGVESGLKRLDEILNGFNSGLHLLAGGPGTGKTTLSLQIALNACQLRTPVIYVTYENSPSNLVLKAVCARAGLVPRDFERGSGHREHHRKLRTAAEELEGAMSRLEIITGTMNLQLAEVRAKAMKACSSR